MEDPLPTITCEGELMLELKTELKIPGSDAKCEEAPLSLHHVESGKERKDRASNCELRSDGALWAPEGVKKLWDQGEGADGGFQDGGTVGGPVGPEGGPALKRENAC